MRLDSYFAEGRKPWRDLYNERVISELAAAIGLIDQAEIAKLRRKLCELAARYVDTIEDNKMFNDTPSGLSYQDKVDWLRKNILIPGKQLLVALEFENRGYFGTFPDDQKLLALSGGPRIRRVIIEVTSLSNWTQTIVDHFELHLSRDAGEMRVAARPLTDLKFALVWDLTQIYITLPNRKGNLGPRVPRLTSMTIDGKQQLKGDFIRFIRDAAAPILGGSYRLSDQAKSAVKAFNEIKRSS